MLGIQQLIMPAGATRRLDTKRPAPDDRAGLSERECSGVLLGVALLEAIDDRLLPEGVLEKLAR